MAKTKKGAAPDADDRMPTARAKGPAGGVQVSSADNVMEAGAQQVQLSHTTKPFAREAWERAKPWMLEQRQKLESQGWLPADHARTELYVLRRTAPHGSYTDDGSIYIRVPKKFIDFVRSAKPKDEAEAKKAKSKRKEHAPSYNLDDPFVWKIKIDGAESEEEGRVPTVMMDVVEPMENIMYLVMTLSPGLVKLNASRKDAMLPGTHQAETASLDPSAPSIRHTALFAASEQLTRTLPPAFWFKRNEEHLRKILGDDEYDATREAAEDDTRSATRELGPVTEKIWEEMLPVVEAAPKKKKKRAASMAIATAPDVNATGIAAA